MPPRRKIAPAGRVYKSATPLQQTKLPTQKKRIKSYGKLSTRRAIEDSTLTQIGFVKLKNRAEEEQEEEDEEEDEEEESDYEQASKKRTKKRRKTAGDQPAATPQYHTQTITQLDWSFSTNNDADEDAGHLGEDLEQQRSIFDVPSSSQSFHLPQNVQRLSGPASTGQSREGSPELVKSREASPAIDMPPPRTPRRVLRQEIPSSQSPATPHSIRSRGSAQRSSLKERSINVPIPFNTGRKPQSGTEKRPKLKIEDTFESGNTISQVGDAPSSPDKRPSPAKSVRFALPENEEDVETPTTPSIKKELTPYPSQRASKQQVKLEILDSDEEEDEDLAESEVEAETPQESEINETEQLSGSQSQPNEEPETFYGDIGQETQFEADRIVSSLANSSPSNATSQAVDAEHNTTGETQIGETQRISRQDLSSMAPRTESSDIFISINPQHVTNIVNRTKNHETRNWAFAPSVRRIWIYETKPVSALKYMAEISSAKKPGEILDNDGLGNAEFDAKPRNKSWNAYEILQLYELGDPVLLSEIISRGWMKAAPQRFAWVRPAVADELIADLKLALFPCRNGSAEAPSSSSTDSQEVEEQLLNTISQFTQAALPSEPTSQAVVKTESMQPPSSTRQETPRRRSSFAHPSQAETVDLTQAQLPSHPSQEDEDEIVWESPARPVPTSTPSKLPTPRSARSDGHGPDSIVPYSMSSSQFMTRSQMLPESLLNEDVPGPPRFVHDSEDEDDEL